MPSALALDAVTSREQTIEPIDERPMSTVCSLVPCAINEYKPGLFPPYFQIPESSDGKDDLKVLHVAEVTSYVYVDSERGSLRTRIPSYTIAKSIVEDFINAQLAVDDNCMPALFCANGKYTAQDIKSKFPDQLKNYINIQRNWFERLVKLADDDWTRYHKHIGISDIQRKAAKLINADASIHEWMSITKSISMVKCKGCFSPVDPNQAFCATCRTVVNEEALKKLKVVPIELK